MSGRTHELHAAVAVARAGKIVFECLEIARLTMRPLSEAFIESYLEVAGPRVQASVGAYQVEGLGVHLFKTIEGDHSTILGLPLLPLLAWFRVQQLVAD
jgi:septum formation protein